MARRPPTLEEAEQFMWDAQLYQRIDFTGPWQVWKMRGKWLISPHGDRIGPRTLEFLVFKNQIRYRGKKNAKAGEVVPLVASSPLVVDAPASPIRKTLRVVPRR